MDVSDLDVVAAKAADQAARLAVGRLLGLGEASISRLVRAAADAMGQDPTSAAATAAVAEQVDVVEVDEAIGGAEVPRFLRSAEAVGCVERLVAARLLAEQEIAREWRGDPRAAEITTAPRVKRRRRQAREDLRALKRNLDAEYQGRLDARIAALESSLRREFRLLYALAIGRPAAQVEVHADRIFVALADAAGRHLRVARPLPDEISPVREMRLRALLDSVAPRIAMLREAPPIAAYDSFRALYQQAVAAATAQIIPPHLDREYRVPLGALYVEPAFVGTPEGEARDEITLPGLLARLDRTVVCGAPGAGKSMLAQVICHRVASAEEQMSVAGKRLTPFMVVLRNYAKHRAASGLSLLGFIESDCRTRLHIDPPGGVVEYLFVQGSSLVVFDGLDELPSGAERRDVRDEIEAFCRRFPGVHVLVTSRVVGYAAAPMDSAEFARYDIAPFDAGRVAQYANAWFALNKGFDGTEAGRRADSFLRESRAEAGDLRVNPLLLALLCALYRGEGSLPSTRPEVYKRCSDLLQRAWDSSRDIAAVRPLGSHLEPTLCHLARWIFRQPKLLGGVERRFIVRTCARYLEARRTPDPDEALEAAEAFFTWCSSRAWVMTEIGRTHDNEPLIGFVHKTFLEYYAALAEVRLARTPDDLAFSLQELMNLPGADVVAGLALQIAHAQREGAGDEVLRVLLEARGADGRMVGFAVRALRYVVPAPDTIEPVIRQGTADVLMRRADALAVAQNPEEDEGLAPIELLDLADAVQARAVQIIADVLAESLEPTADTCDASATLLLDLRDALATAELMQPAFESAKAELLRRLPLVEPQLVGVAEERSVVAVRLAATQEISPLQLLAAHGPSSFYDWVRAFDLRGAPRWRPPLAGRLLDSCLREGGPFAATIGLAEIGHRFASAPTAWSLDGGAISTNPFGKETLELAKAGDLVGVEDFIDANGDASALGAFLLLCLPFVEAFDGIWPTEVAQSELLRLASRLAQERRLRRERRWNSAVPLGELLDGQRLPQDMAALLDLWLARRFETLRGAGEGVWLRL